MAAEILRLNLRTRSWAGGKDYLCIIQDNKYLKCKIQAMYFHNVGIT
jgi:hypothetical protein